jgi:oxygen-dependent protoporphyrinogen oxidase
MLARFSPRLFSLACSMAESFQVAIVGGGISGLACAHRLRALGVPAVLLESEERAGGVIGTVERNGFLFEAGPQSFLGTPPVTELIRELKLEGELIQADSNAPRYVYVKGRLQAVPMSPTALLTTSLLSMSSRFRVLSEPLRRTTPVQHEETVADFVRRKFGNEILEYLVAPFVSGVYAGDPETLSLRAAFPSLDEWEREYGSVLRGAMKSRKQQSGARPGLCSFRGGMRTLLQALESELGNGLVHGARVDSLERSGGSGFTIRFTKSGARESISARALVLAAPAYVSGHLLAGISQAAGDALLGVSYAPVAVIATGYKRRQIGNALVGFGVLIPRKAGLHTLGTVWNSSLFPGRAPKDSVTITNFAGGVTDTEIVSREASEIGALVEAEIEKLLDISGPPAAREIWRYSKALPQYNLGHAHVLENVRGGLAAVPGIYLAGNYLSGPAIGNCIEQSGRSAEEVRAFLQGAPKRNVATANADPSR